MIFFILQEFSFITLMFYYIKALTDEIMPAKISL